MVAARAGRSVSFPWESEEEGRWISCEVKAFVEWPSTLKICCIQKCCKDGKRNAAKTLSVACNRGFPGDKWRNVSHLGDRAKLKMILAGRTREGTGTQKES